MEYLAEGGVVEDFRGGGGDEETGEEGLERGSEFLERFRFRDQRIGEESGLRRTSDRILRKRTCTYVFELGVDVVQRIDDTIFVFGLMFVNRRIATTRLRKDVSSVHRIAGVTDSERKVDQLSHRGPSIVFVRFDPIVDYRLEGGVRVLDGVCHNYRQCAKRQEGGATDCRAHYHR